MVRQLQKWNGAGNDFLVDVAPPFDLAVWTSERAVAVCNRHHGLGADGLLLAALDGDAVTMTLMNADGSNQQKVTRRGTYNQTPAWSPRTDAPLVAFSYVVLLGLEIAAFKWLLLGRVRPGQHALWSCWCSRWDFHFVVWAVYGAPLLGLLEGSLLLNIYLRAIGMARKGDLVILRKGEPADPETFRGVYRLGLPDCA